MNEDQIQQRTQQLIAEQIGAAVIAAAASQARLEALQNAMVQKPHPEAGEQKYG